MVSFFVSLKKLCNISLEPSKIPCLLLGSVYIELSVVVLVVTYMSLRFGESITDDTKGLFTLSVDISNENRRLFLGNSVYHHESVIAP